MLLLIHYTAVTSRGNLQGNQTITVESLTTADDVEALRDRITESIIDDGMVIFGSGKAVIANIMNIEAFES